MCISGGFLPLVNLGAALRHELSLHSLLPGWWNAQAALTTAGRTGGTLTRARTGNREKASCGLIKDEKEMFFITTR